MRGELLRSLRRERGWTQEEAAHRARVSEKLLRKAEQGGRVDGRSLAALASIFSEGSGGALRSQDLLLSEEQASTLSGSSTAQEVASIHNGSEACRLLESWLRAIWEQRSLEAIDRWSAPAIVFHCEAGILHGRGSIRRRYEPWCTGVEPTRLSIEALRQTGASAACQWRAVVPATTNGSQESCDRVVMGGATAIRLEAGMVREVSEFLDPRLIYRQLEIGAMTLGE